MARGVVSSGRLLALITGLFGASVAAFAYQGLFARYVADDFCINVQVQSLGLLGAQVYWYTQWTGKFMSILMLDALAWLGAWTVPFTPIVLLCAWLTMIVAAVAPAWERLVGPGARLASLALGFMAITITLASSDGAWQALDWQDGSMIYTLPIILTTAYLATLWWVWDAAAEGRSATGWIALGALLVALAAGCAETAAGLVVSTVGLLTVCVWLQFRRQIRTRGPQRVLFIAVSSALVAALLASVVVVIAPGNAIRLQFSQRPNTLDATLQLVWFPFLLTARFAVLAPVYLISAYAAPFIVGRLRDASACSLEPDTVRRWRRLAILGAALITAACGAPALYAVGGLPPDRAMVIPQFVLVVAIMSCGVLDGLTRRSLVVAWPRASTRLRALVSVTVALVLLVPIATTVRTLVETNDLRVYAAALDDRERQARDAYAAGATSLTVAPVRQPEMVSLAEPGPDPKQWPNFCIASYYGLDSFVVSDATASGAQ